MNTTTTSVCDVGGSHAHAIIIGNLAFELRKALGRGSCLVTTSDLRVRSLQKDFILIPTSWWSATHRCTRTTGTIRSSIQSWLSRFYRARAKLMTEDSSPLNTEPWNAEGIRACVPDRTTLRSVPSTAEWDWLLSESVTLETSCRLDSIVCSFALNDIYDRITFENAQRLGTSIPSRLRN